MPQPRSTPANDGTMAPSVGMTDPTVAPMPTCASGMSATCPGTKGSRDARLACSRVWESTSLPQTSSFSLTLSIIHLQSRKAHLHLLQWFQGRHFPVKGISPLPGELGVRPGGVAAPVVAPQRPGPGVVGEGGQGHAHL